MLSARYLANISDELVHQYNLLEYEIKKDMFKRIAQLEKVTDLDLYQAEILRQTSGLKLDIDKLISQYDSKTKKIVESLFSDAMNKAEENDLKFFKKAKRELSANQTQVAEATIGKLSDSMTINKNFAYRNSDLQTLENSIVKLTMTVADETEKQFLTQCNRAYMKLSSGAHSWQSAFQDSVESLAKDGVNCVLYTGSGKVLKYSIESAMRMNVLTGINQTASKQTLENLEQLDTDLVEVSAHLGARNRDGKNEWSNHAKWQGKVFCRGGERFFTDADGTRRFAPNFEESCGLGEADGICGINCRHSFYPYFEGTSLEYSKGELDEMKESTVTLDGEKISQYEAEESLRLCERNIRNYKSIAQGFEQTGMTDSPKYIQAKNKIYEWQNKARHITDETGLQRKYINEWIGTKNGKQPTGLKPKD